jgi:hypothetical protein
MHFLKFLAAIFYIVLASHAAAAAERAGYIEAFTLKDKDETRGTVIARAGRDMKPAVMMPVMDGDIVYLSSPASSLRIVLLDGSAIEIKGEARQKIEAKGDGGALDTLAWIWDRIAGNETEESPTNLAAKGLGPYVNAAPIGGTILRGAAPVYLAWNGGKAPYKVVVGGKTYETPMANIEFSLPDGAGDRLVVKIEDAKGASTRVKLRLADRAPTPPGALTELLGSPAFRQTALAAWLARQGQGKWRLEAMRQLRAIKDYEPAERLLAALAQGR